MRFLTQRKRFDDLSEQEILALAISSEEDDAQIYRVMPNGSAQITQGRRRCSKAWRRKKMFTASG